MSTGRTKEGGLCSAKPFAAHASDFSGASQSACFQAATGLFMKKQAVVYFFLQAVSIYCRPCPYMHNILPPSPGLEKKNKPKARRPKALFLSSEIIKNPCADGFAGPFPPQDFSFFSGSFSRGRPARRKKALLKTGLRLF